MGEYIQFGCGLCAPTSWINFDAGPIFWIEKRLPFLKRVMVKRDCRITRTIFVMVM